MDYSKLSDFEINKRVATSLGYRLYKDGSSNQHNHVSVEDYGKCGSISMEWCNNSEEAWSVIYKNKISIMWMTEEKQWCAWANGELEEGCWEWKYCPDDYSHDDNPLRAAMIVFLMMQESASVPANSTGSNLR